VGSPHTVFAPSAVEGADGTAADIAELLTDLDGLTAGETPAVADEEIREATELLAVAYAFGLSIPGFGGSGRATRLGRSSAA
jgi:hypothetical protein